jgi:hypothetical protein
MVSARSALEESIQTHKLRRDNVKLLVKSTKQPHKVCVGRNTLKVTLFRRNN